MRNFFLSVFSFFLFQTAFAQDQIYSQFYNAANYLNPALNGQFEGDLRLSFIHRTQWMSISGPLGYSTFSVDYNVPQFGGGFGLIVSKSSESTAYLKKTNITGIYSYSVSFDNSVLSFGINAGTTNRKMDYEKLVWGDQLGPGGISDLPSKRSDPLNNNKFYFDAGAGINYVLGNFMIGVAGQHLNRPDESFTNGGGEASRLPMRFNAHASFRLAFDRYNEDTSPLLIPSVLVYKQSNNEFYSVGAQYKYRKMNIGVWYRGQKFQNDAIVFSMMFDLFNRRDYYDKVRIGISHDATTSKLDYGKTSGSTEGAVTWETTFPNRRNGSDGRMNYGKRCYDFY